MKLYVGARNYKPDGFLTVDIDMAYDPDIVADVTHMPQIAGGSVDEIIAGHVLEHIEWPDSFKALSEFSRVLKDGGVLRISVPDMSSLMRMILSGESAFHVMGLIYGIGGRENPFERHRYGFTPGMLIDILETIGFGNFDWWNSPFGDGSNGWVPRPENDHVAMSLNVATVKVGAPLIDPIKIYEALAQRPMSDFMSVAADVVGTGPVELAYRTSAMRLYQRVHFQLIESRQRVIYLEQELRRRDESTASAS